MQDAKAAGAAPAVQDMPSEPRPTLKRSVTMAEATDAGVFPPLQQTQSEPSAQKSIQDSSERREPSAPEPIPDSSERREPKPTEPSKPQPTEPSTPKPEGVITDRKFDKDLGYHVQGLIVHPNFAYAGALSALGEASQGSGSLCTGCKGSQDSWVPLPFWVDDGSPKDIGKAWRKIKLGDTAVTQYADFYYDQDRIIVCEQGLASIDNLKT